MLKPLMLRSNCKRDTFAWKRGETIASPAEFIAINELKTEKLVKRALELVGGNQLITTNSHNCKRRFSVVYLRISTIII